MIFAFIFCFLFQRQTAFKLYNWYLRFFTIRSTFSASYVLGIGEFRNVFFLLVCVLYVWRVISSDRLGFPAKCALARHSAMSFGLECLERRVPDTNRIFDCSGRWRFQWFSSIFISVSPRRASIMDAAASLALCLQLDALRCFAANKAFAIVIFLLVLRYGESGEPD